MKRLLHYRDPSHPLYWMQEDARKQGKLLVPDRWTELVATELRGTWWIIVCIPAWIVIAFALAVAPAFVHLEKD